jgi:uncharacterized membrane protein
MPPDMTPFDLAALGWFIVIWLGYTVGQDRPWPRLGGVNHHLRRLRVTWIRMAFDREMRLMDSQLVGHTMNSVTFFASTTMLILAGLLGLLGNVDRVYAVADRLTFTVKTSPELFETKLIVLIAIFIYAFFQFTWALRQYNYTCALIGSAPPAPMPTDQRDALAETVAAVMTHAVTALNGGLRGYYFALAVLTWFIHPWMFLVTSNLVVVILIWRQLWSGTAAAINRHVAILDEIERR